MRPSASKVGLLTACTWWARDEAEWATGTTAAADIGTRFHAAIAEYIRTGDISRLSRSDDIEHLMRAAIDWVDNRRGADK